MISMAFLLSGVLRLWEETGPAIAAGFADATDGVETVRPEDCRSTDDLANVLELFKRREARLKARENALRNRVQAINVAEEKIARQLSKLEKAENSLKSTMAMTSTAAEDDLATLTTVYERMKPKEAAPLFSAMAPDFAAGFLARMKPDTAASILARLDPDSAYTISVILAGRNAEATNE